VIAVLAGGVGAARFLVGLTQVVDPAKITVIANTGDDLRLHGLWISPDIDTVTYTLAAAINAETGWGLAGETWATMGALDRYGAVAPPGSSAGATWFRLGDKDLATHLYRTRRLDEGATLSQVTAEIAGAWGLQLRILPMSDEPVQTMVTIRADGRLDEIGFQDYFVARQHAVPVASLRFAGSSSAHPGPGVVDAINDADLVIVSPSNPLVSIGPIRAVPGIEAALTARRDRTVAISPIVAGAALKGPADRMLSELGHEASAVGVARLYAPIASTLIVDTADAGLAGAIEAEGMTCVVAPSIMTGRAEAAALATAAMTSAARAS
jgi:LPPG:FO 2-phospho-L-lactate transferase